MKAYCNALTSLLTGGIKQRQRLGRFLSHFDSFSYNYAICADSSILLYEDLIFEFAAWDKINRLFYHVCITPRAESR
ncbi:Uncharacterised protein [Klebsiella pneumoniae]|nr:Uncharacterised protein [Klebsiella pneumoniae]SWX48371.1 Uncharacterised protein [Klebsiella pneumoniae]